MLSAFGVHQRNHAVFKVCLQVPSYEMSTPSTRSMSPEHARSQLVVK